jgi:hypothetical protein
MVFMTVTWIQNSDGKYLVESKQHLLQIMNKGSLYTDAGTAPTDYWDSSYIQTSDIDLVDDHANIVPIGDETTQFTGEYDGSQFQIKNWSFTTATTGNTGLFGYCYRADLKHIRLAGKWALQSDFEYAGFLAGYFHLSTVLDIVTDFEAGTAIGGTNHVGGLVGRLFRSTCQGVTVRGTVDSITSTGYAGGLMGSINADTSIISQCRNLASFPNGIHGSHVGGVVGSLEYFTNVSNCLNAMQGDLVGSEVGGIAGRAFSTQASVACDSFVNSMMGDIVSSGAAGGVFGSMELSGSSTWTKLLNYMKGDVVGSTASGGIVGVVMETSDGIDITKSIVAMQGTVDQSVRGSEEVAPSAIEVSVDTSFGMTYTGDDYGSATMVVDDALVYHPSFTDLPYVDMSGTDPDGNVYKWDFVFANVGGKAAFDEYTHLSVHTAQVSAPYHTDFGLAEDNDVVYLTYANVDEKSLYIDSNITVVETDASLVFDKSTSALLSLHWTQNSDGKLEVATKQHLLQIMNKGALYTDAGDAPTDFWASAYLQTSNIDLVDDLTSIAPIGLTADPFTGGYDGGRFEIRNWSFAGDVVDSGLFGFCNGAVLGHIRLSGVWTLSGGTYTGFLAGRVINSQFDDIEADFDAGTALSGDGGTNIGGLIGRMSESQCQGITLRGTVDSLSSLAYTGGIIGYALGTTTQAKQIRNLATFPAGIQGDKVGGIAGVFIGTLSNSLNAMRGDIVATTYAGGLVGWMSHDSADDPVHDSLVNSMVGNAESDGVTGGIFGHAKVSSYPLSFTKLLNYMKGDVVGPTASGGICGKLNGAADNDISIAKSVVAMQGTVDQSVRGWEEFTPSVIEVTVDASFGMTYTSNDYGSATMVVDDALVYHASFTDLPYLETSFTDDDGEVHSWDFVYANVGGKAEFDKYTHLSVHTAEVSAPYRTDLGLGESNDVVYLTYANVDDNSLYIDDSLAVVETDAEIVFDYAKSAVVYGTPDPLETLAWTKDADGKFEVATVQHLLQLMSEGTLYTDLGDHPGAQDYWSSSYVQTSDVDLVGDQASILPIGNSTNNFYGQYDGGAHTIANWSYVQPEDSASIASTGLFGVVTNAEIKRVRLDGVWTLSGSGHASTYLADGFLCGTAIGSTVYDIEADFSSETLMAGGSSTTAPVTHSVGCLLGYASESVVCNVTVKGTVGLKDFGSDGHNTYVGGVIGYVTSAGSSVSLCRNVATFPDGITGNAAGGIVAHFEMGTLSTCLSAMQGDVVGVAHAGGICGVHAGGGLCETSVNSMTGNVQATENAGGLYGCIDASLASTTVYSSQLMNYMRGSVVSTTAAGGGIVGLVTRSEETGDVSITNSIVAMHGSVDQHVSGSTTFVPSALEVVENTDFGMVGSSSATSSVELTGFTTNDAFADLPYIPLTATDPDGVSSEFDFIFANLGGKTMYSGLFTHISLHTSLVSAPFYTDYGLDSANTQVFLTYANLDAGQIFIDDTLTIIETAADVAFNHAKTAVLLGTASLPLISEPRALTISATIDASGSLFRLTYQEASSTTSQEVSAHEDFTESSKIISGLVPETTYIIRLYADDILIEHVLVTTTVNSAENYNVADFYVDSEELYDISEISDELSGALVNELFATGDVVFVDMNFARKTKMETNFVKKGELLDVDGLDAVLLPFDASTTETQESTILLSDETSVTVSLEQGSGDISVGGTSYASGKSFVIDGRKCTVYDI